MTGLWITLGILLFLAFLLWMPLKLHLCYDEALSVKISYLFFRYQVLPSKPKADKPKKAKEKKKGKEGEEPSAGEEPEEKKKDTLPILWEILKDGGSSVRAGLAHIKVYAVEFRATIIREDAYETAMGYGRFCAAAYGILASLRNFIDLRVRAFDIVPDFTRYEGGDIYKLRFKARIRLGLLLWLAIKTGWRILLFIFKQQKSKPTRQGGAVQWQNIQ